jgi:hypothetical protein
MGAVVCFSSRSGACQRSTPLLGRGRSSSGIARSSVKASRRSGTARIARISASTGAGCAPAGWGTRQRPEKKENGAAGRPHRASSQKSWKLNQL